MRTVRPSVALLALMLLATSALAQPATRPAAPAGPPPWIVAGKQLTADAQAAYASIKPALLKLDRDALIHVLADNLKPVLPKAKQSDAKEVAKANTKMKNIGTDLEKTRDLLVEVEALNPKLGDAMTQQITVGGLAVTVVKIPLLGTRDLAVKYKLRDGPTRVTDDAGNLIVLMVKHEDAWYWNPFGW